MGEVALGLWGGDKSRLGSRQIASLASGISKKTGENMGKVALDLWGGDKSSLGRNQITSLASLRSKETGENMGEMAWELKGGDKSRLNYVEKTSLAAKRDPISTTAGQGMLEYVPLKSLSKRDRQSALDGNAYDTMTKDMYIPEFKSANWGDICPEYHQGGRHTCYNRNPVTKVECDHRVFEFEVEISTMDTISEVSIVIKRVFQTPKAIRDEDKKFYTGFFNRSKGTGPQGWTRSTGERSAVVLVPFIVASAKLKVGAIAVYDFLCLV